MQHAIAPDQATLEPELISGAAANPDVTQFIQVNSEKQLNEKANESQNICVNLSQWTSACNSQHEVEIHHHHHHHHYENNNLFKSSEQTNQFNSFKSATLEYKQQQQYQQNNLEIAQLKWQMLSATNSSCSPLTQLVSNHLLGPTSELEIKVDYYLNDIWLTSGDPRSNGLPFIGSGPWKLLFATLIYLYLIKRLLPRLMRPLKPLELQWPIRVYNLAMVVSNLWAFWHGARILAFGAKCFGCETINHYDYSEQAIELLHYGWLFFLSRLIEWLDTIFFVLRKKERQVTKLHVFHHSFVPLISWTYLKYHPGYTVAFFPFVNSLVHSIMYSYYLLATFGPKIQPYLWWKRYLTSLQIAQFVLIIIQLISIPLTGDETCQYPRGFFYVALAGACLFLWLFFTYYIDTYNTTTKQRTLIVANNQQVLKQTSDQQESLLIAKQQQRLKHEREGSSRALSDSIDNAILGYDDEDDHQHRKARGGDGGGGGNLVANWRGKKSHRIV